ncbi:AzlD domain-containing protein [Paenibacillus sp. YPG26]|uniref:AzlD domain-containing protein n=1 Tax=Paenibacillus sp. YPG26 TaxID=2878915 RepID=UPI00203DD410|nr:AzlD domain-containing protein [Paenibacillus sp. YPG26]USB31816.1 AzlD domain-containing protein [Paenibacillus sp. YPG26]
MEVRWDIFLLIAGCSVVTLLPRVVPLVFLSRIALPEPLMRWLSHIPIAVMAALVGQELFHMEGGFKLREHMDLAAGVLTFLVAVKTRNLLWTVVIGCLLAMMLRLLVSA